MKSCITAIFLLMGISAAGQSKPALDSLRSVLEGVYKNDQEARVVLDSLERKYAFGAPELEAQWRRIAKQDSVNQQIVTAVIDTYGWLSATETSANSNAALFLVIQHAPLSVQLKYLPVLETAVKNGKARPADYALLVDRTNMHQGKYQVYGSQVINDGKGNRSFYPIMTNRV
jgi:hypothetical protein